MFVLPGALHRVDESSSGLPGLSLRLNPSSRYHSTGPLNGVSGIISGDHNDTQLPSGILGSSIPGANSSIIGGIAGMAGNIGHIPGATLGDSSGDEVDDASMLVAGTQMALSVAGQRLISHPHNGHNLLGQAING